MPNRNDKFFFDQIRTSLFGGSLKKKQVIGINHFLNYWDENHSGKDDRWLAYILATAHHEVDTRFSPIREYGGKSYFHSMYDKHGDRPSVARKLGNIHAGDGVLFHGRGFVQLTGRYNYTYWQDRLGVDLTSSYEAADQVMELDIATQIIFQGMIGGTFTGKKLTDYINTDAEDFFHARRIVNRLDKAKLIEGHAYAFYAAISYK